MTFYPTPYKNILVNPSHRELTRIAAMHPVWIFDTETTGLDVVGPEAKHHAVYLGFLPVGSDTPIVIEGAEVQRVVADFLTAGHVKRLVAHNALFDYHAADLCAVDGPEAALPEMFDTMAALYHGSTTTRKSLDLMARVFDHDKIPTPKAIAEGRILTCEPGLVHQYLADDLYVTARIYGMVESRYVGVALDQMTTLIPVLGRMQARGMRLLEEPLAELTRLLHRRYSEQLQHLKGLGFHGNIHAPAQVGTWLTQTGHRLPYTEKSLQRGNPQVQTGKLLLERLFWDGSQEAAALLETRATAKLLSAFIQALPGHVKPDGLIYPNITHAHTKTGRFSYSDPNLQQIPKRSEEGVKLRECLTTRSGRCLVADFSQVEMRVAAGLSGDAALLEAFSTGHDIHTEVAARALGKRVEHVTPEERFGAKAINFGILNGMGARRLSHSLRSTVAEAQRWLDTYQRGFPQLTAWMERTWSDADVFRVARTASGRTRTFGADESIRSAVSVAVQGTAADLMRMALIAVDRAALQPVLSVHDEVVCDAPERRLPELIEALQEGADSAFPHLFKGKVRFLADGYFSTTWKKGSK